MTTWSLRVAEYATLAMLAVFAAYAAANTDYAHFMRIVEYTATSLPPWAGSL